MRSMALTLEFKPVSSPASIGVTVHAQLESAFGRTKKTMRASGSSLPQLPSRVDTNLDRRYIRLYEFWLQTGGMLRVFSRGLGLVAELIQIKPMPPRPRFSSPLTRFFVSGAINRARP